MVLQLQNSPCVSDSISDIVPLYTKPSLGPLQVLFAYESFPQLDAAEYHTLLFASDSEKGGGGGNREPAPISSSKAEPNVA